MSLTIQVSALTTRPTGSFFPISAPATQELIGQSALTTNTVAIFVEETPPCFIQAFLRCFMILILQK